ncbi:hypothetical protein KCU92_g10136, partial [Aureobasidium melanogenum]
MLDQCLACQGVPGSHRETEKDGIIRYIHNVAPDGLAEIQGISAAAGSGVARKPQEGEAMLADADFYLAEIGEEEHKLRSTTRFRDSACAGRPEDFVRMEAIDCGTGTRS